MVNNTDDKQAVFNHYVIYIARYPVYADLIHLYLVANMPTITLCPLFDDPEMSLRTERLSDSLSRTDRKSVRM